ncbi:NAD(P)/FAD-dependent oxidoreductase [Solimonas flava]|uniref:NAD(P)/FAD-dependent oxidoreductase n=1 Tax=Solimonas flava TaxID=415849 RepID=UPI0004004803|nr:NAD(P)/FAD-dependent oxidoreductase [Solimonas flava]
MTDVLIIGAGPSGSVAAALLVQRGFDVLVLEKQKFPRFSIGESLLAQSLGLLDQAGMLEAVQAAGFQYKNGAAFAHRDAYTDFNFVEKSSPGYGFTYQVPRADFDQVLINEAQRFGARVQFEVEIVAADFAGERPRVTARDQDGHETVHTPRFVLDASGFGRVLPRLLNLEEPSHLPVRCALYTQVWDRIPSGRIDRQKIRVTTHPRHRDVWYWLIPFSNGKASMGVVAGEDFLQKYSGSNDDKLWALHREDPQLADILKDAEQVFPAGLLRGYSANVKSMSGPGYALLGNAAEFLDPVFSSGVTIALKSAHMAADVLARQLKGEAVDWKADFEEPLRVGVETFRGFVEGWYDGSLQDVIYYERQDPKIRRYICSILAGYAWDKSNPYVGRAKQRLHTLAQLCRSGDASVTQVA